MEKRIKILVDAHAITAGYQGTQTFITGLYIALHRVAPKVEVFFATTNAVAVQTAFFFVDKAHIIVLKKRKPAILRYWFDFPALLKKHQFDFAHFQYISPMANHGCQFIVTTHDILFNEYPRQFSWWYRISRNWLFKRSAKRAAIKTTVSDFSRKSISRQYGIAETDIAILPNAVEEKFGYRLNCPPFFTTLEPPLAVSNFILYVSRIEPRKNQLLLLKTYLQLELWRQNISLVFAGDETIAVPAMQQLLNTLPAQQRSYIHFFNNLDNVRLEELYQKCRLFVYPSAAEGFGIPPLEAAACKAPVLCSNATAMEDFTFFEPYTFNPADATDFAEKLKEMLADPPSEDFISRTEAAVRQKYSWNNTANIFHQLLLQKGGARI
jgi:glycosyltransferase involved in cell wall biosynthesis